MESTQLNKHFEQWFVNPDMLKRLLPSNITPEFRPRLIALLSNESEKVVASREVQAAIRSWNEKLQILEGTGKQNIQAANDEFAQKMAA